MKVLQISYLKSGSYLLWKILHEILSIKIDIKSFIESHPMQNSRDTTQFQFLSIDNFKIDEILIQNDAPWWVIGSQHKERIDNFSEYADQVSHVWTHSYVCDRTLDIYNYFDKLFYIYRDPRDSLVSMAHFAFTPFMQAYHPHDSKTPAQYMEKNLDSFIGNWQEHFAKHRSLEIASQIYFIKYEDLISNPETLVLDISRSLGFGLSKLERDKVLQAISFSEMKKSAPQHVRAGTKGGFKNEMSKELILRVDEICGELLLELGYE